MPKIKYRYRNRARKRRTRRSAKPSVTDLVSLAPGALGESIDLNNPKGSLQNLAHAYTGLTADGKMDYRYALEHQWLPFAGIQIGKRVLGKLAPKLKRFKLLGFRIL